MKDCVTPSKLSTSGTLIIRKMISSTWNDIGHDLDR